MENVEFDYEKIAQMKLDNAVVDFSMGFMKEIFGTSDTTILMIDKLTRALINKGIPLPMALDILMDIMDILTEKGGENHG